LTAIVLGIILKVFASFRTAYPPPQEHRWEKRWGQRREESSKQRRNRRRDKTDLRRSKN
jgi:hypothetical protein